MRRIVIGLWCLVAATAFLGMACVAVQRANPGTLQSDVLDTYCEVRGSVGTGAGVVVQVEGRACVLTCKHVVQQNPNLVARQERRGLWIERKPLRVIEHADKDIALIVLENADGLRAARIDLPPEEGEDVWYVGTPDGSHRTIERCIISRLDYPIPVRGEGTYKTYLLGGVIGWWGNSGGGCFVRDARGYRLVGIVFRMTFRHDQLYAKNPVHAIDHKTMCQFLDRPYVKSEVRNAGCD